MANKRANGEGSIYKRKSDNRWTGKLQIGYNANGMPKYKVVYGISQKEVKDKLEELKGNVKNNLFVEVSKVTFSEWLDTWLNVIIKASIKNTTWAIYENLVRKHIKPEIGGIRLQKLKTVHIQKLYNDKMENGRGDNKEGGLSPKTIKHMHQVIKGSLDQARKEGYVNINVADAAKVPKVPVREMKVLSLEQINEFLRTVKEHKYCKKYYAAHVLELYTGLRRGELLGLRWKDVDLKTGNINIVQQVTVEKGIPVTRELKSESSQNRTINIPPEVIKILKEHRQQKIGECQLLGYDDLEIKRLSTEGLVFTNEFGKKAVNPRRFLRNFKEALKASNMPDIRYHDLRHTFVVVSLQQGVDIKTIQSDLGHNDISTTLDRYGHVNEKMKQEAARKRSEVLKCMIEAE